MNAQDFKKLILPMHGAMYRAAFLICHSEDDAADIVQETLAKMWVHRENLSTISNLKAYCLTSVRNGALTHLRNEVIKEEISDLNVSGIEDVSGLEYAERLHQVQVALKSLPQNQQDVIRLSSFGGCSNEEIAAATGLSDSNVRALLSRGRKKLKSLLNL